MLRISATPVDDNCIPNLIVNLGAYNYFTNELTRFGIGGSVTISKTHDIPNLEGFYTVIVYSE